MNQDVGVAQQFLEYGPAGGIAEVESTAPLAERHLRDHRRLIPIRWIDTQHVSAQSRQEARGHGPGENASETPSDVVRTAISGSRPTQSPCACCAHAAADRMAAAHPFFSTTADSSASISQWDTASATAALSASTPRTASAAARW